jgi:ABC-type multidrug transport system ATPase subunit
MEAEETKDVEKDEKKDAPKSDAPKSDAPKSEPAEEAKAKKKADDEPKKKDKVDKAEDEPREARVEGGEKPKRKKKKGTEAAVRLKRVVKRFGAKVAVDDVSLEIQSGLVYGLIGPNGAGKTTSFSMMAGFLKPTEGYVEVLGFSPNQSENLKGRLGVLPQDALLPSNDKVGEFLVHMARLQGVPAEKAHTLAREVLEEVDGRDWWDMRCGALSHGMAKRVQLAQALIGEPEVVLLDEPTAGLDPRIAYEVRNIVKARKGRCTIVISSHNLHELEEICDSAAILDHGKLVAEGTISELTAASEEIHVRVSPARGQARGAIVLPMEQLRAVKAVTRVEYDDERRDIGIYFDREQADAETVIGACLWVLLNAQVRIAAVTKGRGLEQRVMDLTDE